MSTENISCYTYRLRSGERDKGARDQTRNTRASFCYLTTENKHLYHISVFVRACTF